MKFQVFDNKKTTTQLSLDEIWCDSKVLEESKELVREQTENECPDSSDTYSIPFVRDFEVFLDFIQNHNVTLTKTKGYISRKYCLL